MTAKCSCPRPALCSRSNPGPVLSIRPSAPGPQHPALSILPSAPGPQHPALSTRPSASGPQHPALSILLSVSGPTSPTDMAALGRADRGHSAPSRGSRTTAARMARTPRGTSRRSTASSWGRPSCGSATGHARWRRGARSAACSPTRAIAASHDWKPRAAWTT